MAANLKPVYQFGPCRLDATERVLLRDGRSVSLTPKVFDTLLFFVENAGRLIEKEELMERLWPGTFVEEGNLTFNISVLRKALGEWENGDNYIKTVPKRGYRFVAEVVEIEKEPSGEAVRGDFTRPVQAEPAAVVAAPEHHSKRRLYALIVGLALVALVALAVRPNPGPLLRNVVQITHDGRGKGWGAIVTDGSRLYFTESVGGELAPEQVLTTGGETAAVATSLRDFAVFGISPNGSELLGVAPYEGEAASQLWAVPVVGGSPRRLGNIHGHDPAWSHDGLRLAYLAGAGLFLAKSDGTEPHQIANFPKGFAQHPRWSPRGDSLSLVIQELPGDWPPLRFGRFRPTERSCGNC